mmetsp:Transcript_33125/g.72171  ORF Transcript_33125/g.72171 Transcript_33125/m.72171 type:complete len:516 (+) Transcript_33125:79-1626(+)
MAKRKAPGLNGGHDSSALYVGDLPASWGEQNVRDLHRNCGLDGVLSNVRLLPRRLLGDTGCAILRYATPEDAARAISVLDGWSVEGFPGQPPRSLRARYADAPGGGGGAPGARQITASAPPPVGPPALATPQGPTWRDAWQPCGGSTLVSGPPPLAMPRPPPLLANVGSERDLPTVYLSDVPKEFADEHLRNFHASLGLPQPVSTKFLPQKVSGMTCSVMVRYADDEAAVQCVERLSGHPVNLSNGSVKYLVAKHADAPKAGGDLVQGQFVPQPPFAVPSLERRPARSPDADADAHLPSAYVSDLPGDISEDGVRLLLQEVGLNHSVLVAVKFLPKKINSDSICAMLRYPDLSCVHEAIAALNGHSVMLPDGSFRSLVARVAEPPRTAQGACQPQPPPPLGAGLPLGAFAGVPAGGGALATDLYLSEIPVEWGEDSLRGLHAQVGLGDALIAGIKILPRRHADFLTGAAIVKYVSHAAATSALAALEGQPVSVPGGQRNLVARFADPPKAKPRGF